MKKRPLLPAKRNHELGSVVILVAVMWTALFGMAVLAVDFGYLYTKRRGVQAVADAAVRAAMPIYMTNGLTLAAARARAVATANGYVDGTSNTTVQFDEPVANSQFRARIGRTYPTFFGSLFGLTSKIVTGTTVGRVNPGASTAPAILALGGCGSAGVRINGDTDLTINGHVQSNGPLDYCGGPGKPYTTNGDVQSGSCVGSPSICTGSTVPPIPPWATWDIVTGTLGVAPSAFADPFATAPPPCTVGNLGAAFAMPALQPGPACPGGQCYFPDGVYCAGGDINLAPVDPCGCLNSMPGGAGVTFIATGAITVGGNGGMNLTANNVPQNPNRILFWTQSPAAPAFNFGGCAGPGCGPILLNGAIYAPAGRINMGSQDPMTVNGSIVGLEVNLGLGTLGPFVLTGNGAGGGGGTAWTIYQ